ncbi:LacI family transcriptional regulator [Capsulimonas corticalis]|uniref:LacI family transcriptional regulator n=1 Tax=Capsulimonas corticalis TaxID=2219043 RepID=A0A402CY00_9BACT|nr:LacI family DNA-binding transcriptional regulator [Capsulimonas corticalis]BDI32099.1 LacI family transcriptional regulator [Capsulimonas corticalis]
MSHQPGKIKRVSLRDVAAKAGIGVATASAVLNGSSSNTRVSDATRARILEVARELQYYPNAIGRTLAGHPTRTIGVIIGLRRATLAEANPFAFAVLEGIVAAASLEKYNILLFTESWKDASESLGPLRDGRIDGVIVIAASDNSDILTALGVSGLPAVSLSSTSGESGVPTIDIDNEAGTILATRHLLDLGHRRIAHLSGDENLSSAVIRRQTFLEVCASAGAPCDPDYLFPGTYEDASGYERTLRLLRLPHPPTAIFAASDALAIAALRAAHDSGVQVPNDLSVIGFNDERMDPMVHPPLTTIRQDLGEIGMKGVRTLVQMLRGGSASSEPHLLAPTLIVRKSTAPPPASR